MSRKVRARKESNNPFFNQFEKFQKERKITIVDMCNDIGMCRTVFYKTKSKAEKDHNYDIKRYFAIALCVGLKLRRDQYVTLLSLAGYTLCETFDLDCAIIKCLKKREFASPTCIDLELDEMGLGKTFKDFIK